LHIGWAKCEAGFATTVWTYRALPCPVRDAWK